MTRALWESYINGKAKPASKYHAKRTEYNGRVYDSKGEAVLAQKIDFLIRTGEIEAAEPQKTFELFGLRGTLICKHRVDFFVTYADHSQEVWEYKGCPTKDWIIKKMLFHDNHPQIKYRIFGNRKLSGEPKLRRIEGR